MVKAPEAPPHPAESPVALAEERVVVGGPFAMRLGFEHAPVQGERSALRVSIEDAGGSLSDAKVEVGLRAGSGREELLSVRRDGNVYLADADFRSAGRHHLRVAAGPRGAESPLKSAFDFEVAAAVGAQAGREPPKRHERAGRDEDDKPIPTVVIEAPHNAPQKPRALGPSPAATGLNPLPIAQPPIVPLPASPPPSRVVPVPVAPSPAPITPSSGGEEEEDPYKVLDNKR
jgi:hypothetical protein